jgi:methyl-accepting chemotaxis protein
MSKNLERVKIGFYISLICLIWFIIGGGIYTYFTLVNTLRETKTEVVASIKDFKTETTNSISTNTEILAKYLDKRTTFLEKNSFKLLEETKNEVVILRTDISETLKSSNKLISTYQKLPERLETKFAPFFDCETNENCFTNLTTDTLLEVKESSKQTAIASTEFAKSSASIARTSEDFSKDFNKITTNLEVVSSSFALGIPKIVDNVERTTKNIEKLTNRPWWERVLGIATSGSMIWFNLNRAKL